MAIFLPMGNRRARETKKNIYKCNYIKLKNFCTPKETIIKMKREHTVWENIFANDMSNNGCFPKYIKNLYNSTPGKQTTQF